ncbi:MAG: flagellar biosynthesis protein FliQ [Alphaproteobacteria bacterium]|nr:flagellar biosynthesis protein FliQ [Alphaproteobacteria bacterium]
MTDVDVLYLAQEGVWVLLKLSGPLMFAGLLCGVLIGLLQALTQIQEMTLVFIPKIVTIFMTFLFMMPFMGSVMSDYMNLIFNYISRE